MNLTPEERVQANKYLNNESVKLQKTLDGKLEESVNPNDHYLREYIADVLTNNATSALNMVNNYHNQIGYISSDAFVQGMNVIGDVVWDSVTGRNDFVTVFEQEDGLQNEIDKLNELKNKTRTKKEFEEGFQKLYGVPFNYQAFEDFKDASIKLNQVNTYESIGKYFDYGIEEITKTEDMDIGFKLNALLNPIFNNPMKTQEYINELKKECKTDDELKTKVLELLSDAKKNAEAETDKLLKGTSREELETDYKNKYKKAMGDYHSEEIIQGYIENSQRNAMYSETAGIIALSMMSGGSAFIANSGKTLVAKYGARIGSQILKAGMTVTYASLPAAETIVSGLTSKEGLTNDKANQSFEQLKTGLMYGSFGAYISGPLGNTIEKILMSKPNLLTSIISSQMAPKVVGATVETTADVLFDRLTSDLSIRESFEQNGLMNFAMMFMGSSQAKMQESLSDIHVEKMKDGTYNLIDGEGNFIGKAKTENELATIVLGKAKDLFLNHTSIGRKVQEGYDNAKAATSNNFKSSKESSFSKVKEQVKSKLKNIGEVSQKLGEDKEFLRLFNSFVAKNAVGKPELQNMIKNYDFTGMNDVDMIKMLIETSGVGITKFAQIISKDKTIMANFEKTLPPEEFKNLQDALIACQSKCDFSRTPEQAQAELDKLFPLRMQSSTEIAGGKSPKSEYTIQKENSAGSVGATYWATDKNGKKVVVKMLKAGVDMEQLGMEEKLFKKLIEVFAATPEDAVKYSTMIHNQYKDWYNELDFKQEGIYNQKLTQGAKRYSVAQVQKVSKDGTVLIMDKAQGVQMNKLMEMLEFYKQNGADEYKEKYKEDLAKDENKWLNDPQKIMSELPLTLTKTFDEQMLFIKKGGETVMHGDPHMGNIFVYNDANNKLKIEFIDTGNCVMRNNAQIQGDIAFFSNYMVGNSEGVAKYFMKKSGVDPAAEPQLMKQIAESMDERVFKKGENITQFENVQKELNAILEEAGLDIGSDESNALKAQLQFISNISSLNALSGKPLDVTPIFMDIPPALMQMVRNGVNPISSLKDALGYAYNNKVEALSNALQFKVKKQKIAEPEPDIVTVEGTNKRTFKFARETLHEVRNLVKNRHNLTDEQIQTSLSKIAENAHILKSQVEDVFKHLTTD